VTLLRKWGGQMLNYDGKLVSIMSWITRFFYIQLLWIGFSLFGLVIGGLFPATFTLFGISRKWIREGANFPIFQTYLKMFKGMFIKANILGWFMVLFAFSLYFYYSWFIDEDTLFATLFLGVIFVLLILYLFIVLFLIPVFVHFDVSVLNVIKYAFITSISKPLYVIGMLFILIVNWFFWQFLTIIFLCIGISSMIFMLMLMAHTAFVSMAEEAES